MQQRVAGPPRHVPLTVRIAALLNPIVQAGFIVAGFGSIFVWVFLPNADLSWLSRGATAKARGYVTSVNRTNARVNRVYVRANAYTFSVDGRQFTGLSYSTGQNAEPGDEVTVEYNAGDPSRSHIEGMRPSLFGGAVLIVLIFPGFGLLMAALGMAYGASEIRSLRDREVTTGKAVERQKWPSTRSTATQVTYEFLAGGTKYRRTVNVYDPARIAQDEALLIYDPALPNRADLLKAPLTTEPGQPVELAGRPGAAIGAMIIPAIVIVANVIAARALLFR